MRLFTWLIMVIMSSKAGMCRVQCLSDVDVCSNTSGMWREAVLFFGYVIHHPAHPIATCVDFVLVLHS